MLNFSLQEFKLKIFKLLCPQFVYELQSRSIFSTYKLFFLIKHFDEV